MTYKIGTRVKLVRPKFRKNYGKTGVIVALGSYAEGDFVLDGYCSDHGECIVQWDDLPPSVEGQTCQDLDELEPILPKHEPCESEFQESLSHLLSRLKGVEA